MHCPYMPIAIALVGKPFVAKRAAVWLLPAVNEQVFECIGARFCGVTALFAHPQPLPDAGGYVLTVHHLHLTLE